MQADRGYPVGRGEDGKNKGCLQENRQETEEQRVSSCSAGSRWSYAMHEYLEGVFQGKIELRQAIRERARPWKTMSLGMGSASSPAWQAAVPCCSSAPPGFFQLCPLSKESPDFSREMARGHSLIVTHPSYPWNCCGQQWLAY